MFNRVTALYWCQKLVLLNILRMHGQNLIKFCIHYIIDKIYVCIEKGHFLQIFNRGTALVYVSVRNCSLLNILRMDGQNLIKFCIHITIDKVWVGIVFFFFHFCERATALDWYRNWCLLNILRMDGQNLTKFFIHIFFDKIYVDKIKRHFHKFAMELWPLIDVRNWCLLNILIMNVENLIKFCIYITIDMIYPPSVLQTELCSWTYFCPLIVLWRGYGQILWQF